MAHPKHVHAKRRRSQGTFSLANKLRLQMKRRLQALLSIGSALRGRHG